MTQTPLLRRFAAALAACALLAACGGEEPSKEGGDKAAPEGAKAKAPDPGGPGDRSADDIAFLASARSLHCPDAAFLPQDTFTVTANGRWQNAPVPGGHFLRFDSAAVPAGTQFTVTRAYADSAALDVRPVGAVAYNGLVGLTISYASCTGADTTGYALFREEPNQKRSLQGRANRNRSVTAELDHFSVYFVGGN